MDAPFVPASPMRGIAMKLASVVLFVGMQVLVKLVSEGYPAGQIVFARSIAAVPVIVLWLAALGELRHGLKAKNPVSHIWRGLVGTTAMAMMFLALGLLPLPEVTAIGYATPIMVVAFAGMFLGERVGLFRTLTVLLGLAGVMIVLVPSLGTASDAAVEAKTLGAVLALMSAVCAALAQVFVRRMVREEHPAAIVFWFSITASVLSLMTLPWGWVVPSPGDFMLLVTIGLIGGAGQILLTSAYRHADASLVAPFQYASILVAVVAGYTIFGEVPTEATLVGGAVVIVAGVLIIWRERRLHIERGRARRAGGGPNL
ncbi:MAG: DMT family transporter [Pseudomonadota bacterium]